MARAVDTAAMAVIGVKLLGLAAMPLEALLPTNGMLGGMFSLLIYMLRLGIPTVLCVVFAQSPPPRSGRSLSLRDGAVYVIAAVGIGLCANYLSAAAVSLLEQKGLAFAAAQPVFTRGAALIVELLSWTLFPAILEELFFRGALYGLLSPYGERRAVLLSALFFALCHSTVGQLLPAFVMGVMLAWLRAASGGVLWCIGAHMLYNGVAAVASSFGGGNLLTFAFGAFALIVIIVKSAALPTLSAASDGKARRSFWLWAALIVTVADVLGGISFVK